MYFYANISKTWRIQNCSSTIVLGKSCSQQHYWTSRVINSILCVRMSSFKKWQDCNFQLTTLKRYSIIMLPKTHRIKCIQIYTEYVHVYVYGTFNVSLAPTWQTDCCRPVGIWLLEISCPSFWFWSVEPLYHKREDWLVCLNSLPLWSGNSGCTNCSRYL